MSCLLRVSGRRNIQKLVLNPIKEKPIKGDKFIDVKILTNCGITKVDEIPKAPPTPFPIALIFI